MSTAAPPLPTPTLPKREERNVLLATCMALVAVVASMSALNVAQQELAVDLGVSQGQVLWIINAYTIALAALLMPVGAIGDRWGRKPVLMSGLVVFGVASVAVALSTTTEMMIAARVVAGMGAAMVMPVTLSVITSSFSEEDRPRAIGIWAGLAGSGAIIGLFVSAFAVDALSWRWSLALPVALAAAAIPVTRRHVPNSRETAEHPFDVAGSVLSAIAIGTIVLAVHEGPEKGWTAPLVVAGLAVGLVALVAFVVFERRHPEPLLDVHLFGDRRLASGSLTLLTMFALNFGTLLVLFPFLQVVLGWSALKSAAGILPLALAMMPLSMLAPRIVARIGSRYTMLTGALVFVVGLVALAFMSSVDGGYLSILPGMVLLGAGLGLCMTPATAAITATLPADKQGVASALNDTTREVGGALGVALLGSVMSAGYRASIESSLDGMPTQVVDTAGDGIASALGVAAQAGDQAPTIISAAQHALVAGWHQSMWAGVLIAAVPIIFLLLRGPDHGR